MYAMHTLRGPTSGVGIVPDWYFSSDPKQNPHINPHIGPELAGLGMTSSGKFAAGGLAVLGVLGAVAIAGAKPGDWSWPVKRRFMRLKTGRAMKRANRMHSSKGSR
jgi:hypothetical protein